MVGTSGQAARRCGAITASGLSAPLATCGSTTSLLITSSSTTPPRPSVSAWLLPRYGTCSILVPVCAVSADMPMWATVP